MMIRCSFLWFMQLYNLFNIFIINVCSLFQYLSHFNSFNILIFIIINIIKIIWKNLIFQNNSIKLIFDKIWNIINLRIFFCFFKLFWFWQILRQSFFQLYSMIIHLRIFLSIMLKYFIYKLFIRWILLL